MEKLPKGWTLESYIMHNEAMRKGEEKFEKERDQRYAEVKQAEEKALIIKDRADRDALNLAREIQKYKDEKANDLRSQIESERGNYATGAELKGLQEKTEAIIAPVVQYVASQQGQGKGMRDMYGWIFAIIMAIAAIYFGLAK